MAARSSELDFERDERWTLFFGDIQLEEFRSAKVPNVRFKTAVNVEVQDAFRVIQKLLIHSYYEYLFVDLAVVKALHIFEMALKIRYKEVTHKTWNKSAPLEQLINWFRTRNYFERTDEAFFDYVRNIRNHLSHPNQHSVAGGMWFHWINTVVDLINDIYDGIDHRLERRKLADQVRAQVKAFVSKGIRVNLNRETFLIYDNGPILIDNFGSPPSAYISLLPVFDLSTSIVKHPIIVVLPVNEATFGASKIRFATGNGNELLFEQNLPELDLKIVSDFRNLVSSDDSYGSQHSSLIFDANGVLSSHWRILRLSTDK